MRDLKLYNISDSSMFDINIVDGFAEYVTYENQTQDQRAALGAIFEKSTMPGNLDFGVDWAALYAKDTALLTISNDIQETVAQVAGGDGQALNSYLPIFVPQEDGTVSVTVIKGAAQ